MSTPLLNDRDLDGAFQVGMGTENAARLLASLIGMTRPEQLLEIGAGHTTVAMLAAMAEAAESAQHDRQVVRGEFVDVERLSLLVPRAVTATYQPSLLVFEDFSVRPSSADRVVEVAGLHGWTSMLRFVDQDFTLEGPTILRDLDRPVDLAWLDAGDPIQDVGFVNAILPFMAPDSWIVMHEPSLTLPVRLTDGRTEVRDVRTPVVNELIRRQGRRVGSRVEFVVIPEPHKLRQGGVLLIHKVSDDATTTFPSMADELLALQKLLGTDHRLTGLDPVTP